MSDRDSGGIKVVSPLKRFLMTTALDDVFAYLHQTRLQFTITRCKAGTYKCILFAEGIVKYEGHSKNSPKAAISDALAVFLTHTEHDDYHTFMTRKQAREEKARFGTGEGFAHD